MAVFCHLLLCWSNVRGSACFAAGVQGTSAELIKRLECL